MMEGTIAMAATYRQNALGSIALAAGLVAAGFSCSALAGPRSASGGVQAKIDYCETCHGVAGQGYYGYFAMPRLAGQQPEYLVDQLRDFTNGQRRSSIMANVARGVSPSIYGQIAAHFRAMNPAPLGGGGGAAALGQRIFMDGIPESNVPACWACHGEDAHGARGIPRLAGQLPSYIEKTIANWDAERSRESEAGGLSALMVPTTHNLTRAQVAAIAAYVSGLR